MARQPRTPYVVVEATIRRNGKLAELPSDAARLGYVYVLLGEAKLLRPQGRFASRSHFDEVAGRFARYRRDYLRVGLLEESPGLCEHCRQDWGQLPDGVLVTHNFRRIQSDPWAAERAEEWRGGKADPPNDDDGSNGERTAIERPTNDRDPANDSVPPVPASRGRASRQRDERYESPPPTPAPRRGHGKNGTGEYVPKTEAGRRAQANYRELTDDDLVDETLPWSKGGAG